MTSAASGASVGTKCAGPRQSGSVSNLGVQRKRLPIFAMAPPAGGGGPWAVSSAPPRAVRLSVTDRCDMACTYCRPHHGEHFFDSISRLRAKDWITIVQGLRRVGVRRVRITGGEPLLHREIESIVRGIAGVGIDDLALTTNGARLAELALPLRHAGLRRINISLDSLDAATFSTITRGASLPRVLSGIDAALDAGFDEIKTNTVMLRGVNDGEFERIVEWTWARGITPRFIEAMPIGVVAAEAEARFVSRDVAVANLGSLIRRDASFSRSIDRGPAEYAQSADGRHRVGFISGSSRTFCDRCDRIRVTSQGRVRACLVVADGLDLTPCLREPRADEAIAALVERAWAMKPTGAWRGCHEPTAREVSMRETGG